MVSEQVKGMLEELVEKMDKGAVYQITKRVGYQKVKIAGTRESAPLPMLRGTYKGVDFDIEFLPYPEGGFLLEITAQVDCPFKLVLTLENHEIKSIKFKGASVIPVTEIEIGIKEFDDRYFIETLEEDYVKRFLRDEEVRKLIDNLDKIDRLAFQYKYVKLVYYVENLADITVDWIFDKIDKISQIAHKIPKVAG